MGMTVTVLLSSLELGCVGYRLAEWHGLCVSLLLEPIVSEDGENYIPIMAHFECDLTAGQTFAGALRSGGHPLPKRSLCPQKEADPSP
jgi:hypothetical protein